MRELCNPARELIGVEAVPVAIRSRTAGRTVLRVDQHDLDEVGLLNPDPLRPLSFHVSDGGDREQEPAVAVELGHAAALDVPRDERRRMPSRRGKRPVGEGDID
ncbi:MAG: hypothetical protein K2X35_05170 [Bryobacteraceae bacterium]|nr:hypothetical protein [Bryobacteraceae bacterium]